MMRCPGLPVDEALEILINRCDGNEASEMACERVCEGINTLASIEWAYAREVDHGVMIQCCPSCEGLSPKDDAGLEILRRIPDWQGPNAKSFLENYPQTIGHEPDCRLAAVLYSEVRR